MGRKVRDFQRKKLYSAERECSFWNPPKYEGRTRGGIRMYVPDYPVLSLMEAQELADLVIQSSVFRARRKMKKVLVKNGRVNALGAYWTNDITLPDWARTEIIILHELCHVAIDSRKYPAHGKQFAGLMLDLYREFLGTAYADELEENYIKHGVQYDIR